MNARAPRDQILTRCQQQQPAFFSILRFVILITAIARELCGSG